MTTTTRTASKRSLPPELAALGEQARRAAEPAAGQTREAALAGPLPVLRSIPVEIRRAADGAAEGEAETITVALSSEQPVLRYDWWEDEYYYEVLDHAPASVDLAYARDGMPFLYEHMRFDQRGICENVRVDADRRLRADVRFSARQDGQDLKRDMLDGIRPKVSVYALLAREFSQDDPGEGKIPTRRYTKWMPVEGSSVSIPGDYDVGVGRSADAQHPPRAAEQAARPGSPSSLPAARQAQEHTVNGQNTAAQNGAANTGSTGTTATVTESQTERARAADILGLAQTHGIPMARALAWVNEGKSADEVAREILHGFRSGQQPTTPAAPAARVQLTDGEERRYSMVRGIQALLSGKRDHAGFEFEVSDECARQLKKETSGFFVPTSIRAQNPAAAADTPALRQALGMGRDGVARAAELAVGNAAGKGPEAKFTEYGGFIDLLRNRSALLQLGAQLLPGLQGDVAFVGQTGAGVAGWTAEDVNTALSSLSMALRSMQPKGLQSASTYTRKLLLQAPFSVENLVRSDIAKLHSLAIDKAGINGTGANDQPRGILNTVGIGAVVGGVNGAIPTYGNIVDLETEVAVDNADINTLGYLTNARMRGRLKKTAELDNAANGRPVWTGGKDGEMNGYSAFASNQVPSNLTKGTAAGICSAIIFGAFGEMIIGEWGAQEILVDQLTLGPAIIKVMSIEYVDIFLRYVEAFAAMQDALAA